MTIVQEQLDTEYCIMPNVMVSNIVDGLSWTTLVVHNRDRPEIHGKTLIERTQTMPKK